MNIIYVTEVSKLKELLPHFENRDRVMIDSETNGLIPFTNDLLLLQIGTNELQLVIDVDKVGINNLHLVREVIGDAEIVGHNIKFDLKFFKVKLGWEFEDVYDTMLAEKVIFAGYPMTYRFDLKSTLWRRMKIKMDKETRNEFIDKPLGTEFSDEAIEYSGLDVLYLFDIQDLQRQDAHNKRVRTAIDLEMMSIRPLADAELAGIKIDVDGWRELIKVMDDEASQLEEDLHQAIKHLLEPGKRLNWNSPKQVKDILNAMHPEVNWMSTGKEALEDAKHLKIPSLLLQFRERSKFSSSFGESLLDTLYKGRLRTNYGLVSTGRMSSSQINLQQIPSRKDVRSLFIPEKGYKLITADYSSQELVIIASLSKEPAWINALKEGKDLHSISASMLWGKTWDEAAEDDCEFAKSGQKCECPKHIEMRDQTKGMSFLLAYGGGAFALSKRLGVTEHHAQDLMDKYFRALPKIHDFLTDMGENALMYGFSKTAKPIQRKRFFPYFAGLTDSKIRRQGTNAVIQGTAGDQTKIAVIKLWEALKPYKARIVAIVHDEIVVEARDDENLETVRQLVKDKMEEAGKITLKNNLLKTNPKIGDTWRK